MLEIFLGLLVVVPLTFYSLWISISGATNHPLHQALDYLGATSCHLQSGVKASADPTRRANFDKKREPFPKRGSGKIFAAHRKSGSNIRKILQPYPPFSKERFAPHTSICISTGPRTPYSMSSNVAINAPSSPLDMGAVIENLKDRSVSTGGLGDEASVLIPGMTDVRANHWGETLDATSGTGTATTLMTLPIEIRSAMLREVLGDRRVHTHVDQNGNSGLESARLIPKFTFCCDAFIKACFKRIKEKERIEFPERASHGWRHPCCFDHALVYGHNNPDRQHWLQETCAFHKRMREEIPTLLPLEELLMGLDPDAFDARLSVLAVCKQLRSEGLRALYSSNIFSFNDSTTFGAFLRHVGIEKASLIRKIELSLTFENDKAVDEDTLEFDGPHNITSDWTVGGFGPGLRYENMWAALDGLTEVTIWVCDTVPIVWLSPNEWNKGRETRLKRIRLWLRWIFGELRGLHTIRKVKVFVCWRSGYEGLATSEQIRYEADEQLLQSVGDDFAKEILAITPDRFNA